MSEEIGVKPIVINREEIPQLPKPTIFDWLRYYAFNLYRKPLVFRRKKQMLSLTERIYSALNQTLLPKLWERRTTCEACRDAYAMLKTQVYLSQTKIVLQRMKCAEHARDFDAFMNVWIGQFEQCEKLAAWICGFGQI